MKKLQKRISLATVVLSALFATAAFLINPNSDSRVIADNLEAGIPTPTPEDAAKPFDQDAALAKLRESIKGHEKEPAETVFKNIQKLKGVPAGRMLAIMQFGYARSLGVNCTHCHTPDKWESEDKRQKQITRDMAAMSARINGELLKGIKNLKSEAPTINCTTCHRGQIIPALDMAPASRQ